jgi:gamma-glutamylcyclotransferase (GGCT)/AIG2-like uncharacterized protein YtfP
MGRVMEHLFVYGTLAPGQPNEHVLAPYAGGWTPATVRGELLDRGWGPENGYPSIALRTDGGEVRGLLFGSEAIGEHWSTLDAFEGPGYERVRTTATTADGEVEAWVYVDRPAPLA